MVLIVVLGFLMLALGVDLLFTWLLQMGIALAFGLTVNFWGLFLIVVVLTMILGGSRRSS